MRTHAIFRASFIGGLLAASALSAPALAQDASVDEVVVTATKRTQSLRDVPIAITVQSQADLQARGVSTVEAAVRSAPGVTVAANGENSTVYTIRGVNTSAGVGVLQSPVSVYIDELPTLDPWYSRTTTNLRTFDVDRIEVLRGPQGTLFGSGSLGGAIRVITNKPDASRMEGAMEATLADTRGGAASYALNGMLNAPFIKDLLALRVVGYYQRDGGYVDNIRTGRSNVNDADSYGGRAQLAWTPSDRLKVTGSFTWQKDNPKDTGLTFYPGRADPYTFDAYVPQRLRQNLRIYNVVGEYDFGFATLTSSTTYAKKQLDAQIDFTRRVDTILGVTLRPALGGATPPSPIYSRGPSETYVEELRLASSGDGPFRWLIGGFYMRLDRHYSEIVETPGAGAVLAPAYPSDTLFDSETDRLTKEQAVFGEISYDITPSLTATAGLRSFRNTLHVGGAATGRLNGGNSTVDRYLKQTATTPKVSLTWKTSDDVTLYAQAAKGYRIGYVNSSLRTDPISGQVIPAAYGPDKLWNYEVGAKGRVLDGRLTASAAAYFIDWKDIQLQTSTVPSGFIFTNNAGDAEIKGLELELAARPTSALSLGASVAFNHSKMVRIDPGTAAVVGDRLPGSADFTGSAYIEYRAPISGTMEGFVRVDYQYVSDQVSDLRNTTALRYGDYGSANLRAGVTFGQVELIGFIDNLGDGDAIVSAFNLNALPVAIRQRPRTIGVTTRARF